MATLKDKNKNGDMTILQKHDVVLVNGDQEAEKEAKTVTCESSWYEQLIHDEEYQDFMRAVRKNRRSRFRD